MIFGAFKLLEEFHRMMLIDDKYYPVCSVCDAEKRKVPLELVEGEFIKIDGIEYSYIYKCPVCGIRYLRHRPIKITPKEWIDSGWW